MLSPAKKRLANYFLRRRSAARVLDRSARSLCAACVQFSSLCRDLDSNMSALSYATKQRIRGMLADKQAVASIAEELEVSVSAVQALADAKPRPVRARA